MISVPRFFQNEILTSKNKINEDHLSPRRVSPSTSHFLIFNDLDRFKITMILDDIGLAFLHSISRSGTFTEDFRPELEYVLYYLKREKLIQPQSHMLYYPDLKVFRIIF